MTPSSRRLTNIILQVDDQMNLLQHNWSEILLLDHIHQKMHKNLGDEYALPNGQHFDLNVLCALGLPSSVDPFNQLVVKLIELKFDPIDYVCFKFMLLLNPGE